jgi:hypothetical protein
VREFHAKCRLLEWKEIGSLDIRTDTFQYLLFGAEQPLTTFRYSTFLYRRTTMKSTILQTAVVCVLAAMDPTFAQTNAVLPLPASTVSTIPGNGDVNPYGVAFVPRGSAATVGAEDILVTNFNNSQNLQGTGSTIMRVNSLGQVSQFFSASSRNKSGLTAAIGVLGNGTVIVGNLPTADGTSATAQAGSLSFIDRNGNFLGDIVDPTLVNGPWGMAIHDSSSGQAQAFVSNVLTGAITRFDIVYSLTNNTMTVTKATIVGSGFNHRADPAALELGPSGLAFDAVHNLLYIASSADNAIYVLANAGTATASLGTGTLVYQDFQHLHGPLQMVLAPSGHLLVANSDGSNVDPNQPSELVEFTTAGQFIGQTPVDRNNGGAFGLALANVGFGLVRLAYIDDNANTLTMVTTLMH